MSGATSFATYDAATQIYEPQTREQFYESLTADIQRALNSGVLDEPQKPVTKTLREIQAEEAAAAEMRKADAVAKKAVEQRVAAEKAAAEKAWEEDRAARDASGHKPCWVCARYAKEMHYHAPKQGSCALTQELFYVHDRWGQPHTAYVRHDVMEALLQRKARAAAEADTKAAEAAKKAELGNLLDAALSAATVASPKQKPKKGKKATVEKFSLDEI